MAANRYIAGLAVTMCRKRGGFGAARGGFVKMLNRNQQSGRKTGIDILGDVSWKSKYKTLLENLPQKIFLKDTDSVYISCNENCDRDLKINAEEFASKPDWIETAKEQARITGLAKFFTNSNSVVKTIGFGLFVFGRLA